MKIINSFIKYKSVSFGNSIDKEKTNSTRLIVILGSFLYGLYSIIDFYGLPTETFMILFPPRLLNFLMFVSIFVITFKQQFFLKHYDKIIVTGYIFTGLAICFAIFYAEEEHYSHGLYFAALMCLIFMSYTWSYLPIKYPLIMSALFIVTFALIKVYVHKDTSGSHFLSFFGQMFYLTSVVTIAAIAQVIRDNLIKSNIVLKEKLRHEAFDKIEEVKKQQALANMDMLTGIPNRRYITECLRDAILEAEKNDTQLTILFIDLNGFKRINDTYGHDAGDRVLEISAKRIEHVIRQEDYLARLGGDEFLLGFVSTRYSEDIVDAYSKKIRTSISAPIAFNGQTFSVGTSIGVSNYPSDGTDIETLIKVADQKMYIDKQEIKRKESRIPSNNIR